MQPSGNWGVCVPSRISFVHQLCHHSATGQDFFCLFFNEFAGSLFKWSIPRMKTALPFPLQKLWLKHPANQEIQGKAIAMLTFVLSEKKLELSFTRSMYSICYGTNCQRFSGNVEENPAEVLSKYLKVWEDLKVLWTHNGFSKLILDFPMLLCLPQ